jgi:archaellum component FlaC
MASHEDIMRLLGRLEEGIERLTKDFQDEKQTAHASRSVLHSRLDDQAQQLAHLDKTIAISGQIDAQIRGEIVELRETVKKNNDEVSPSVADWKRMKTLGIGIAGLIGLGGLTVGGILVAAGDAAVSAIRAWLKIS